MPLLSLREFLDQMFLKVESKLVASVHMKPQSSSEQEGVSKLSVKMSPSASCLAGSRWRVIAAHILPVFINTHQ